MTKYANLCQHLESIQKEVWRTTFSEVERILGQKLPPSARKFQAWWANDKQNGRHWKSVGWHTKDLDISHEKITFVHVGTKVSLNKNNTSSIKDVSRSKSREKIEIVPDVFGWDEPSKTEYQISMNWIPLGKVQLDNNNKLQFKFDAPSCPAIYRFRVRRGNTESVYIGETDNLKRRFGNYRNAGATQKTSIRINEILRNELANNAEISLSAVIKEAYINYGDGLKEVSLDTKTMRCLFENAALLSFNTETTNILNKGSAKKVISLPDEN